MAVDLVEKLLRLRAGHEEQVVHALRLFERRDQLLFSGLTLFFGSSSSPLLSHWFGVFRLTGFPSSAVVRGACFARSSGLAAFVEAFASCSLAFAADALLRMVGDTFAPLSPASTFADHAVNKAH